VADGTRIIAERQQVAKVLLDVEEPARLPVEPELCPGKDLE
jgi:hypothetical protein